MPPHLDTSLTHKGGFGYPQTEGGQTYHQSLSHEIRRQFGTICCGPVFAEGYHQRRDRARSSESRIDTIIDFYFGRT